MFLIWGHSVCSSFANNTQPSYQNVALVLFHTTYLASQQVNDLKGMFDNGDGLHLLAVVATVHHEGVDKTFHHGTLQQHRVPFPCLQVNTGSTTLKYS